MSFSKEVKEELSTQIVSARHCQIAEMAAIINICGRIKEGVRFHGQKRYLLQIRTENLLVARKFFQLVKGTFHAPIQLAVKRNPNLEKSSTYEMVIKDRTMTKQILEAVKLLDPNGTLHQEEIGRQHLVMQNVCCKRAFIRGAFLASGSISAPEKTYHFEIVTQTEEKAKQLQEVIRSFQIDAKIVLRKKYYVVYIKDGAQIVDILNVMEAHVALMNLENVRILKEMRNSINRQVNCETANINKTVVAATKQIDDIIYIKDTVGFGNLTKGLREIAEIRIEQPDASLKELGAMLNPAIGKSGVNHRLRKLSMIADQIREQKEEKQHDYKKNNN